MNRLKLSILAELLGSGDKGLTVKQLADRLDTGKKGIKKLENTLAEMKNHGDIAYKKSNCWIKHPELYFKAEVARVNARSGFIRSCGEVPAEFFVRGRDLCGAIPGDIVLARQTAAAEGELRSPEAVVLEVLQQSDALLTGVAVIEDGSLMVLPDSLCREPLVISRLSDLSGIRPGDKVVFTIKKRGERHMDHKVTIVESFGSCDTARAGAEAYLLANGLHVQFPDEVLLEAGRLSPDEPEESDILNRLDLRGEPIFTIDGADTKDIDDAVSIDKTDKCYKLGVHIADVSHYVKKGSKLDEEAFYRGTSIYYADRVVPMLPPQLSNGICSLNPKVDRLAFSCLMEVSFEGKLLNYRFVKSVIRSRVKGVYSEVNKLIDGTADEEIKKKYAAVADKIPVMKELADILEANRIKRGAPEIDTQETKILTDENGVCIDVKPRKSGVAEGIIEEFMLMANNSAAALAMSRQIPFVYRVHEAPAAEKLEQLSQTLAALGINPGNLGANASAGDLAEILRQNKDSERAAVINRIVLRTMMKAKYSEEPLGHYGLVMPEYSHFTSPIRRYADLSIHRILTDFVYDLDRDRLCRRYAAFSQEAALRASLTELAAVKAERDITGLYMAEYMKSHVGEEFDGMISGVSAGGVYVALPNTVEGMVSVNALPPGEYEVQHGVILTGAADGSVFTVGDKVRVKCVSVNVNGGFIDFEFV